MVLIQSSSVLEQGRGVGLVLLVTEFEASRVYVPRYLV
jgi:hypothetical protein